MKVTQHKIPGRLADLSAFDMKVMIETSTPLAHARNAVVREPLKCETETQEEYGCVDWYHYSAPGGGGARSSSSRILRAGESRSSN